MKPDLAAFRRLTASDQLAAIRGQRVERVFAIERSGGIDEKARTAWLSIASEQPYERWWGIEILDVAATSIRAERLRAGAALLVDHNPADQVGVVEAFEITPDRKLRILARFGRSARAEEIWQDVQDGIRRNTSVGYVIHDLVLERQDESVSTYRVTDWEPLEGSLVSVPADHTVGVGRSRSTTSRGEKPMDPKDLPAAGTAAAEHQRVRDLIAAGEQYERHGGNDVARELILNPAATMETFRARMLERMSTKSRPTPTGAPADLPPFYGEGARTVYSGPKLRVFSGEHGEERAFAFGQFMRSQLPNGEDARRWCAARGIEQRILQGCTGPQGGYLVPDELASELIKNMDTYGVFRREAQVWPMSSDMLSIPTREGGVTAQFIAEGSDSDASASDPSFGLVNLVTKEVMTVTKISQSLMEDSTIALGDHVAFEISEAFAKLEDECGFIGDGTSAYGGMQGIVEKLAAGSRLTAASNHDTAAEIDATDLSNLMAKLPQYAHPGAKWYMSMAMYGAIIQRLLLAAGGNTVRTLEAGSSKNPQFAGFPVVLSPALPSDTTADYSGEVMLLFGDLRRASAFGDRRVVSILVDPYTLAGRSQIRIIGRERFDVVNHGVGTASAAGPIVALVGQ